MEDPVRARRQALLSVLVAFFLLGAGGTAASVTASHVGADGRDTVSAVQVSALPRALPERVQPKQLAPPHLSIAQAPAGAGIAARVTAASSYQLPSIAACCGDTVPAWAGRAPPSLL
jgi:hypothetical protein